MIVKIDHIALGVNDFNQASVLLEKAGYHNRFLEYNVSNMQCTKQIMRKPSDKFDISLFEKEGSIGIELLNYGHLFPGAGKTTLLGDVNNPDQKYVLDLVSKALGKSEPNLEPSNSILISTTQIDESIEFWKQFRFQLVWQLESFALMRFKTFFPKGVFYLCLATSARDNSTDDYIDNSGEHVIAFISDSAHSEYQKLQSKGYDQTVISPLVLNNQNLEIFFVRSPSGAIAEVISISL